MKMLQILSSGDRQPELLLARVQSLLQVEVTGEVVLDYIEDVHEITEELAKRQSEIVTLRALSAERRDEMNKLNARIYDLHNDQKRSENEAAELTKRLEAERESYRQLHSVVNQKDDQLEQAQSERDAARLALAEVTNAGQRKMQEIIRLEDRVVALSRKLRRITRAARKGGLAL